MRNNYVGCKRGYGHVADKKAYSFVKMLRS